jgi:phosphoribosylformylglycinamidine cyclo-ligase
MDYKSSGVDIDASDEVVRRVRQLARGTFTSGVISEIGSFGGLFRPDLGGYADPVLVASADGVGTKLRIAFQTNCHNTVGRDLVNHCVNDILVQGATPLFFLDYLAVGRLSPDVSASVIEGVATGCRDNGCALLGGETAEMPGFYADGEYDLAGFIVGVVDRQRVIDGQRIEPGDRLIGLRSAGLHTNGYSLARQIMFETAGLSVESPLDDVEPDTTVGDQLLRPHRSYLLTVQPLLNESPGVVRGLAHITGGGLTDNLPRILPSGTSVKIDSSAWTVPPLFRFLQDVGDVPDPDMYRTFNMGIGMVVVCAPDETAEVVAHLGRSGESEAVIIGEVVDGEGTVIYA